MHSNCMILIAQMIKQTMGCSFQLLPEELNSRWSITPDKNLKTPWQILLKTVNPGKIAQMCGKYVKFKTSCF